MKDCTGSRVLMLLENAPYPQDGRAPQEARALADAGYQVAVVCPRASGQPWRETIDGVRVHRYPAPPEGNRHLAYLWEYAYAMMATFALSVFVFLRHGFDVIHAHNPPDALVLIAALYRPLGKRFVFDHHDLAPELYRARFGADGRDLVYQVLVWLEKLSCRFADHVIATNESYKEMEMQRGGVPESRITIVRNGPDVDRLRPVGPDEDLRQKGKTIIAYIGEMGFQDGVDYLLRALHHLVESLDRTDFYCLFIGEGDALGSLKTLATQLGLDEYVWFTGWLSAPVFLPYLSAADICVDPAPSNEFNDRSTMVKIMEYMALGKPIVAFDLPEHRFTAQSAALYVPPNDELEFARALIQLMDDPGCRKEMGSFGRRRVESELTWHHSAQNLLAAYRRVLSKPCGDRSTVPESCGEPQ